MGDISLPRMARNLRIAIWLLLILLTMAIFLFPVHLKFEYHSIQSSYIFENLPLFGALYFAWMLSLLWLLLSTGKSAKDDWQKLALIAIFAIAFLGFWAVITPQGYTTDYEGGALTYVRHLQEEGEISSATPRNFGYFQFPITSLLGHAVSQVTGLDIPHARTLLLLFNSLLLGILLYVFFRNTLKSTTLASVAALLAIQGNLLLSKSLRFYPAGLDIILFAVFLLLLSRRKKAIFETTQDKIIAVILMLAITATHYITAFYVLAVLIGIYAVQILGKSSLIKPLFIIPLCIIPLAWGIFWATPTFNYIVGTSSEVVKTVLVPTTPTTPTTPVTPSEPAPALSLWWVGSMAKAYLGAQVPLWARVTIAFWVLLIFVFGAILVLRNLFMVRKLSIADKKVTGAMLGIPALTALAVFTSLPIGGYQFFRFFQFSGFFTIPIMLSFLWSLPLYRKRQIFISLILVPLFLLSFPTFLAHNNTIQVDAIYPQEASAGKFVESVYGKGKEVNVFTDTTSSALFLYYLPDATFYRDPELVYTNREHFYRGIDQLVAAFEYPEDDAKKCDGIFVLSPRITWSYYHIFGIEPTHPKWSDLENRVSKGNQIYNNGFIRVYKPEISLNLLAF